MKQKLSAFAKFKLQVSLTHSLSPSLFFSLSLSIYLSLSLSFFSFLFEPGFVKTSYLVAKLWRLFRKLDLAKEEGIKLS